MPDSLISKNSNPNYFIWVIIIASLSFASCKTKKLIPPSDTEPLSLDSLKSIIYSYPDYQWYEAQAKLKAVSPEDQFKGKMRIRIRRDSAMLIAVRKLSQEGARVLLTTDSIHLINRLDHTYQIKSLDHIKRQYGLPFSYVYIESLLRGSYPNIDQLQNIEESTDAYQYKLSGTMDDLWHHYTFDRRSGRLISAHLSDRFSGSIKISYNDYKMIDNMYSLPAQRYFEIYENDILVSSLSLEYYDEKINESKPITFKIPSGYTKIE